MDSLYPIVLKEALRILCISEENAEADFLLSTKNLYYKLTSLTTARTVSTRVNISVVNNRVNFGSFSLHSASLSKLLKNCKSCVLIACTLGTDVDKLISRTQIEDMSNAVVLDALASALVEAICDRSEAAIAEKLSEKEYMTMRFSPGYGDVPHSASEGIFGALDAKKKIGMGLTESFMLIPIKSITAFIGISDRKEKRAVSCDLCAASNCCIYRKRGDFCGILNKR